MSLLRCIGGFVDTATHQADCPVHRSQSNSVCKFSVGTPDADARPVASLLLELQAIRDRVITAAEKRTADECIEAVRKVFGVTS